MGGGGRGSPVPLNAPKFPACVAAAAVPALESAIPPVASINALSIRLFMC